MGWTAAIILRPITFVLAIVAAVAVGDRSDSGASRIAPARAKGDAGAMNNTYPLTLEGSLDEPLSRWRWLVKWLLAIPHWFCLVFLWAAFVLTTIAAFFVLLFTG